MTAGGARAPRPAGPGPLTRRCGAAPTAAAALLLLLLAAAPPPTRAGTTADAGVYAWRSSKAFARCGQLRLLAIGDSITKGSVPSKNKNMPYAYITSYELEKALTGCFEVQATVAGAGPRTCMRSGRVQGARTLRTGHPRCPRGAAAPEGPRACAAAPAPPPRDPPSPRRRPHPPHRPSLLSPSRPPAVGGSGIMVRNGTTVPDKAKPLLKGQRWDWVMIMVGPRGGGGFWLALALG
jgi:hypothetical protein